MCFSHKWHDTCHPLYRVAQKTPEQSIFRTLLWSTVLSFFILLDRASFPHYNNTKIIKFGWELFILWVISYGLSFSGFAIHLSLKVLGMSVGPLATSVASFLVLGGGGARPPNVPTKIICTYIARASASETYIFRTQNTSAYNVIYNQCGFL